MWVTVTCCRSSLPGLLIGFDHLGGNPLSPVRLSNKKVIIRREIGERRRKRISAAPMHQLQPARPDGIGSACATTARMLLCPAITAITNVTNV
jgi:hypothetical protein